MAVCGFSAGGHLAAALVTMGRIRPNAMILAYACILAATGGGLPSPMGRQSAFCTMWSKKRIGCTSCNKQSMRMAP
ncbi:hypothetical protein [Cohnella herbarum]|uniref:hypothetical protein n=1 Tax=Cohnella herbarum TaxID=2728023 RepID=UPI00287387D4|nr:hypothetical protein [Cohnella herbarum]